VVFLLAISNIFARASVAPHPITDTFAFEVFSIHLHKPGTPFYNLELLPNGYRATIAIRYAIMLAYFPQPFYRWGASKIINAPDWTTDELYDVDARVAPSDEAAWQQARNGYDSPLLHLAWKAALRDRCKLQFRTTTVDVPYLDLVVGKSGAKLAQMRPGAIAQLKRPSIRLGEGFYLSDAGKREFIGVSMDEFASYLVRISRDYPIQNKTGLNGRYDFSLPVIDDDRYPPSESLSTIPINNVGLALRRGVGPALNLTIEHIERPDPN
jgi:uncharacterized protein (TIGR03435 family)